MPNRRNDDINNFKNLIISNIYIYSLIDFELQQYKKVVL